MKNSDGDMTSSENYRLVVLESGLGLESGLKSIFAGLGTDLDLDLDLKALDLDVDSDLEVLSASPFFKSFVLYLCLKNVPISYLRNRLELEYK